MFQPKVISDGWRRRYRIDPQHAPVVKLNIPGYREPYRSAFRRIKNFNTRSGYAGQSVSEHSLSVTVKCLSSLCLPASNNEFCVHFVISVRNFVFRKLVPCFANSASCVNVQIVAVNLQVVTITVESRPISQPRCLFFVARHMHWLAIPVFIEFGVTTLHNP